MKLRLRAAVGDAVLIHPKGKPDHRAVGFAEGLARDVQNTLVVVDLPPGAVDREWESVARLLSPARYGSLRLVFGRGTGEEIRTAGQRIADRLGREVLVPDGRVVPTAAGGLFVPSDQGDGWLRCRPGRPAQRDSQRFPKPQWEFSTPARPVPTGTHTVADPVPGGVWVRDTRAEPSAAHRRRLVEDLTTRPDVLLVVVGAPGAPAIGLEDLACFWDAVLPNARPAVRFALYGTVDVPAAVAPGQGLADALGEPVVLCAGLPVGEPGSGEMRVSGGDTLPGWRPYAGELSYVPVRSGQAPPPVLSGLRPPLAGVPEVATGLYEYAPDAVLEVVQSGLWLRPRTEPPGADDIRRVPAAPGHATLHVDCGTPQTADSMLALAEDLRQRLCAETGAAVVLAPADAPPALDPVVGHHGLAPAPLGAAARGPVLALGAGSPPGDGLDGPAPAGAPPPAELVPAGEHPAPLRPLAGTEANALTSAALAPLRTRTESGGHASAGPAIQGGAPADPDRVPAGTLSGPMAHPGARRVRPGDPVPPAPGSGGPAVPSVPPPTEPAAPPRPAVPEPSSGAARHGLAEAEPVSGPASDPDPGGIPAQVPAPAPLAPAPETRERPPARPGGATQPPAPAGTPDPSAAGDPDAAAPPEAPTGPAPGPARAPAERPVRPAAPRFRLESAAPDEVAAPPAPAQVTPAPAPASRGGTGVRVQPTPKAGACAVPLERGVAQERDWVRRTFNEDYNAVAGSVSRVISESPGLRGGSKTEAAQALTELVAVRLYLSGDHRRADDAVRAAIAGPHVPLARCVTAGLRRLPSYRGPALLRARLSAAERAWYREGRLATEWAFCHARTVLHPGPRGGTDFLIWSMTARRTSQLDPSVPDRVLFLPGTSFKVLRAEGTTVLLRELSPSEIAEDGRVEVQRVKLDEIAVKGLEKILDALEKAGTDDQADTADPPGLIVARRREGANP